jgi:hypothetical protein
MSAPIVSHIAGLIRAYFPKLNATEVKEIILKSYWKPIDADAPFTIPNRDQEKTLAAISKHGGIINAALCIQNAANYQSKKNKK